MALPDRTALRTELQTFDDVEKKVVGGMLAAMFGQPAKIRDREWMSEQFTQVALLTGQFEDVEHAHDGVERAQVDPDEDREAPQRVRGALRARRRGHA